ncbi:FAP255 [Auxenochlorella protothecoides x Auxenochlorella symbiontica]
MSTRPTGREGVLAQTTEEEASTSTPVEEQPAAQEHLVLRLAPRRKKKPKKGVQWAEDVVDNETLNRRKSKKCCIFHKQKQFGEWSDSDSECDCPEP